MIQFILLFVDYSSSFSIINNHWAFLVALLINLTDIHPVIFNNPVRLF